MANLVLTLIGPDRPGIVDAVSDVVSTHGGNWLESRMAQLAGKFAGVLCIEVADDRAADLEDALRGLEARGLHLVVERSEPVAPIRLHPIEIELVGQDRPGLVREIANVLAAQGINVEELSTDRPTAAMSGTAMFQAHIRASVPEGVDLVAVRQRLERLAADLMADVRLIEALGPSR
ncbi:MAG TPA: ACT domain-containing protein [Candidatus Limnocylindrales bacterium]